MAVKVKRLRAALREDGEVLAVLGAEVAGSKALGAVLLVRPGMTAKAWKSGTWLCADLLNGAPKGRLLETEEEALSPLTR